MFKVIIKGNLVIENINSPFQNRFVNIKMFGPGFNSKNKTYFNRTFLVPFLFSKLILYKVRLYSYYMRFSSWKRIKFKVK